MKKVYFLGKEQMQPTMHAAAWKEHVLQEIPVSTRNLGDAVTCLLHTILFTRAPGPVRPSEATCEAFPSISYSLCAVGDVGRKVEHVVLSVEERIHHAASYPATASSASNVQMVFVVINFFERKVKKALFGLMSNEEKRCFEKWILPFQISTAMHESQSDETFAKETEAALQNGMLHILSLVQSIEHIPNAMYDFEIAHFNSLDAIHQDATTAFPPTSIS